MWLFVKQLGIITKILMMHFRFVSQFATIFSRHILRSFSFSKFFFLYHDAEQMMLFFGWVKSISLFSYVSYRSLVPDVFAKVLMVMNHYEISSSPDTLWVPLAGYASVARLIVIVFASRAKLFEPSVYLFLFIKYDFTFCTKMFLLVSETLKSTSNSESA